MMQHHQIGSGNPAGGRASARRLLPVLMAVLVTGAAAAGAEDGARVTVDEEDGIYRVAATFSVTQPGSVALEVLTDYEEIPRFMPGVRTSTVVERTADGAVVEQEAVARLMIFSRRIQLRLDIHEAEGVIRFRDRSGRSFTRYEGAWTVTDAAGHATIVYELTAKPTFSVPGFLLRRLLERDAQQMIESLQTEISARAVREDSRAARRAGW